MGVLILSLGACSGAFAQAPQLARGGVVNAASWASPITPGAAIAIFGSNLATKTQSASAPLPFALGGTSVTFNGVPAPILFVSPTQINVQVPASIAAPDSSIAAVPVVVNNSAGSSTPEIAGVTSTAPGFFSADGSGCGSAAALNIRPDGTVSVNSPSNSAAPGDYIALFGTGFGLAAQQPPDGAAATGAPPLQSLNPHKKIGAFCQILKHPGLLRYIRLLMEREPRPLQTIAAHKGSQQGLHSDSIHMTTYPLGYLTAAWIAFEDIDADCGPLVYYPGSHGIHGGSPRRNLALSRRSVVCHFFVKNAFVYHDLAAAKSRQQYIGTCLLRDETGRIRLFRQAKSE